MSLKNVKSKTYEATQDIDFPRREIIIFNRLIYQDNVKTKVLARLGIVLTLLQGPLNTTYAREHTNNLRPYE